MVIVFKSQAGNIHKGTMVDKFMRRGIEKVYKVNVNGDLFFVEFWRVVEIIK